MGAVIIIYVILTVIFANLLRCDLCKKQSTVYIFLKNYKSDCYSWLLNFSTCVLIAEPVDWTFAQLELLEKQGIDLRKEMEQRSVLFSTHLSTLSDLKIII